MSNTRNARSVSGISTAADSPGARCTTVNPLSSRTGRANALAPWRPTYSCAVSDPARSPVLVRVKRTESSVTVSSEYSKLVKLSPNPKGKATSTPARS